MYRNQDLIWRCADFELRLDRPRIMGVLNVTPDSFSDGGSYKDADDALEQAFKLLDAGADIIDVGGESTRPGFSPVDSREEAKRVVPVVKELVSAGALVSIDTRHADIAQLCARLGVAIVNDVTGFVDPAMLEVAKKTKVGCVVMHAGAPAKAVAHKSVKLDSLEEVMKNSQQKGVGAASQLRSQRRFTLPEEAPILREIMGFLSDQARLLLRAGVAHDRICLDPGAGFGKSADEDVVIQRSMGKLASLGYPLLCAVSRKRMVGAVSGVSELSERDTASIGASLAALANGAHIMRVHDVKSAAEAANTFWALYKSCPRRAFVALGSNVGDRVAYLARACAAIDKIPMTCITQVSHAYETDPAYGLEMPVANAVAEIRTELAPLVLLDALLKVEKDLGRIRDASSDKPQARTIDCDLLWIEGEKHAGHKLVLPHPRLGERDFVLVPSEDLLREPEAFFARQGIKIKERSERVGTVRSELGEIAWSEYL